MPAESCAYCKMGAPDLCRCVKASAASPARGEGDAPVACYHEPYQGSCVHCGVPFRNGRPTPATPAGEELQEVEKLRDDLRKFADGCVEARQWGGPTIWPDNPITDDRARAAAKVLDAILAALQPQAEGEPNHPD